MRKILLLVIAVFTCASFSSAAVAPWEIEDIMGKQAPPFSLKNLDGRPLSLADYKGKVVLINFWATWCKPCRVEMPSLNKLFKKYGKQGLVVIGVSIDKTRDPVREFLEEIPLDFPIVLDSDTSVSKNYKVFAFPTTFLIDRGGILKEKFIGEMDWMHSDMTTMIEEYLKQ